MFTDTVLAMGHIPAKEMVVVRDGRASRYTGEGTTHGASLGLAPKELAPDQPGEVEIFLPLMAEALPTGASRDVHEPSLHEERIFNAQIGSLWGKLSVAVNALARNQPGRKTVDVAIDDDDIIVRSTSVWRAFGFVLDRAHHRLWAWTRKTYVIQPLSLDLIVTAGQLQLTSAGDVWPEADLVAHLRKHLSP